MKEEFEDILRQQLEGFESEDFPAGLWEGIEQKLDAPKVVPLWKKLSAVAASVLILGGIGVGLVIDNDAKEPQQMAEHASKPHTEVTESNETAYNVADELPAKEPLLAVSAHKQVALAHDDANKEAEEEQLTALHQQDVTNEGAVVTNDINDESTKPRTTDNSYSRNIDTSKGRTPEPSDYPVITSSKSRVSVKLYASQMPQGDDNNMKGYLALSSAGMPGEHSPVMMFAPMPSLMDKLFFANANKNEEPVTNSTYAQPVRIGLSVGYDLNSRWGMNLGVVYTKLNSTLKSGGNESFFTNDQHLNYIGIPVNISYNLLQTSHLRVYASAGEMTEFGTGGDVDVVMVTNNRIVSRERNELHDLPVQFSVNASAGAEYSFYHGLGVFAEPGVSYHFRDHSDISSIYKVHPLNFNLQIGLRWIINK